MGEGTAVAVSSDRGLGRAPVSGRANVLAKAASDGNEGIGELERGGSDSTTGAACFAGTGGGGLLSSAGGGGGGCDSEVSHASFAAFSSVLTNGSNSWRISCFTGSASGGGSGVATNPGETAGSNGTSGTIVKVLTCTSPAGGSALSCHGFDDACGVSELDI